MSIIGNVEKYMKRYDYLIEKQQRKCKEGKTLSKEEHDELRKLRPNVFTPILMMFELLHDTVKSNQVHRQQSARVKSVINQTGGTQPTTMNIEEQSHNNNSETKRLSELEESLLPLLTKIIMYIELNKKKIREKQAATVKVTVKKKMRNIQISVHLQKTAQSWLFAELKNGGMT